MKTLCIDRLMNALLFGRVNENSSVKYVTKHWI